MKNLNLISSMEAHILVNKAIECTLESLKESPLESIREAASYWEMKLGRMSSGAPAEAPSENRKRQPQTRSAPPKNFRRL